jgi:hypothetical protein
MPDNLSSPAIPPLRANVLQLFELASRRTSYTRNGDLTLRGSLCDLRVALAHRLVQSAGVAFGIISIVQIAAGRMYMDARKSPEMSHASGVRNQ